MTVTTGSVNYENAISRGYVVGSPVYAGSEPHHMNDKGVWLYVEMFHAATEEKLATLFETDDPVRIDGLMLVWSEDAGTRLRITRNGVSEDRAVPDDLVLVFENDAEVDGEWVCFAGSLGRE